MLQISDNSLNEELTILQSQLEDLRSKYTNAYPGIVAAEQRLNSLMKQRVARDSVALGVQGTSPEAAVSIIESRQNLNLELSRERGEVGALRVRVNGLSNQVARMKKNVDVMPRVEAQLAQLDRDYGVIKQTYEGLVQRREATALSHQADTSSSDFQFQVIESPVVPTLPVSPDRFKLVIAVFIMALGAGIMLAIVLSQMKEYIASTSKLKEIVNFPVYGSITEIISVKDRSRSRRRMALLSVFWSMLLMVFAGLMYITLNNISLANLLAIQGWLV
jgi:polysaccharide chain length determinant protein (PEP-CTERM system associated)